jgi:hypothetical protein
MCSVIKQISGNNLEEHGWCRLAWRANRQQALGASHARIRGDQLGIFAAQLQHVHLTAVMDSAYSEIMHPRDAAPITSRWCCAFTNSSIRLTNRDRSA